MEIKYKASVDLTYDQVIDKIENFTFPSIKKKVLSMKIREPYYGVWALEGDKLLGVALADNATDGVSELFSLFVLPEKRNKGIGRSLINAMETLLKERGVKIIQSRYQSNWKSINEINKLIKSGDWKEPVLARVVAEGEIENYKNVPWPEIKISSDYEIFQWENITPEDKNEIERLQETKEISHEFNPYQHQDKIYMPASLGLRHKGKLAGWNIVYLLDKETAEYNNLFIVKEYRKIGHAITLLHKAFGRQYEENLPKAKWLINGDNIATLKIFKRIAGKHLSKYYEVYLTAKKLN